MLRRLYDIANVLTSLRLLEKVPTPTIKRGCRSLFKWLGAPPPDQRYQPRAMPGKALADAEALQQVCPSVHSSLSSLHSLPPFQWRIWILRPDNAEQGCLQYV